MTLVSNATGVKVFVTKFSGTGRRLQSMASLVGHESLETTCVPPSPFSVLSGEPW